MSSTKIHINTAIERDIDYLHRHRIVYRKYPEEKPTKEFSWGWVYENGTEGYFSLFNTMSKINTLNSFRWHLRALKMLNPNISKDDFISLGNHMLNLKAGFCIPFGGITVGLQHVLNIWEEEDTYINNQTRYIVFKDGCGLSKIEKQKLSGKYGGKRSKKTNKEDVKQQMLYIRYNVYEKITHKLLAESLFCSQKTIQRNMSEDMVELKNKLNDEM